MIIVIETCDVEKEENDGPVASKIARRKNKTNKEKDKEGKERRRDSGYKHVHEHQFNSFSAIPLSSLSNYT